MASRELDRDLPGGVEDQVEHVVRDESSLTRKRKRTDPPKYKSAFWLAKELAIILEKLEACACKRREEAAREQSAQMAKLVRYFSSFSFIVIFLG